LSWCSRGRQTFVHYPGHTKKAVLQAYSEGNHHFGALAETFGIRSASTVPNWIREYKETIRDGRSLMKDKDGRHHMGHRDTATMTDREIKIEDLFLRTYVDELLKEVPDNKKALQRRLEEQLGNKTRTPMSGKRFEQ
jgi:transposase-like protein